MDDRLIPAPRAGRVDDHRTRAMEQISQVVQDLEDLRFRLLGVHASLPDVERDLVSSLRAGIECVLADRVGPALEALRGLVDEVTSEGDVH